MRPDLLAACSRIERISRSALGIYFRMKRTKPSITRSRNMARIRSKDSSFEMLLRRELWSLGLRYRANDTSVFGKPDIVFRAKKVAIFVDSEFWHGKDLAEDRNIPKTNSEFWRAKLKRNIERDQEVNDTLRRDGWKVIRIWTRDLKNNLEHYVAMIYDAVRK